MMSSSMVAAIRDASSLRTLSSELAFGRRKQTILDLHMASFQLVLFNERQSRDDRATITCLWARSSSNIFQPFPGGLRNGSTTPAEILRIRAARPRTSLIDSLAICDYRNRPMGTIGQGRVLVEDHPFWRPLPPASDERICCTLPY